MYRHKILLRQTVKTLDDLLQEIENIIDYGSYWAMIKNIRGQEVFGASQEQMRVQSRFVVKYAKSLETFIESDKTTFEILYKGVVYDVKEVVNDNHMNETITIFAEGRV